MSLAGQIESFRVRTALIRGSTLASVAWLLPISIASAQVHQAVLENPLPQSQTNSCQSYALAYALAYRYPELFSVADAMELRQLEQRVREAIKYTGGPGRELERSSWRSAVRYLSHGELTLADEWFRNEVDLLERVKQLSGSIDANTLATDIRFTLATNIPVLLSVISIENQNYGGKNGDGSHIVVALGVSDTAQSPKPIMVLNPAIKTPKVERNICAPFDTFTERIGWSTSVSVANKYRFKHLVLSCVRKADEGSKQDCE